MISAQSISGRKVSASENNADFYQTPEFAITGLLEKENFKGSVFQPLIWEPCCGNGAISNVLKSQGYNVLSTDLRKTDYTSGGIDVLKRPGFIVEHVITNPPYHIAQQIIESCLEIATGKVCMLLKLSFLESVGRQDFYKKHPPVRLYAFHRRVTMYPEGTEPPKNNGTIAFAWFVWEKGYKGKPLLDWI